MALVNYAASSDEETEALPILPAIERQKGSIVAAPAVSTQDPMQLKLMLASESQRSLITNVGFEDMSRPLQGPLKPFHTIKSMTGNVITGAVELQAFNESYFRKQQQNFSSLGFARDPSLSSNPNAVIGDIDKAQSAGFSDQQDRGVQKTARLDLKRKRQSKGDLATLDGENAWKGPWARHEINHSSAESSLAGSDDDNVEPEQLAPLQKPIIEDTGEIRVETHHGEEVSEFFGAEMHDYQGRTYMHAPQDLDIDLYKESGSQECFMPKKKIHTWDRHKKGVSALRFFPKSGHLLLSCSMDSKIMLWDCHHERGLLRDFQGHSKAVRDVNFNSDGTRFLSAGYDTQIKLWDTETGKCLSRYSTGKIPLVVSQHPDLKKQEFLVGTSDKKIVQFDMRSGEVIQEYTHHLGPINTITYIDGDRRFVTTSDDKTLRAWEYGIPVPFKFVAEPEMRSIPAVSVHPSGKYFACSSLDNRITVWSAIEKIKAQRRKVFRGHGLGGLGIQLAFSPDGKYLSSGDAGGFACFWDWKTCKLVGKLEAHTGPTLQIAWHPQETSKVATGGNDGLIHYWD